MSQKKELQNFVVNKTTKILHKIECWAGKRIGEKNRISSQLEEVDRTDYQSCKICHPEFVTKKEKKMVTKRKPKVKIGLMSGMHYGNTGCREGLWHLAAKKFKEECVDFVVLVGGLVDGKAMYLKLKEVHKDVSKSRKKTDDNTLMEQKAIATTIFLKNIAKELADKIPHINSTKIYLITSPAYDKDIGQTIAEELSELRDDIWLYGQGNARMNLRQINQVLGLYTPKKGIWMRGNYFDTPAIRVLIDEKKRSTRGLGDINVVGCLASSIHNPGDSTDVQKPYLTLPALYKIDETRIAENQIGIRVLTFYSNIAQEAMITTYSFKDLVANEWKMVKAPDGSSKIQKTIINVLRKRGPSTIGQLEDFTKYDRNRLFKAIIELKKRNRSKWWPGLHKPKGSNRYFFGIEWFQTKFRYELPKLNGKKEKFLNFCCLHAGCKHTDMQFFRDEIPKLILENNIQYFIGSGDFIEGLYHDLLLRGEIYGSVEQVTNYTYQENLAAYLVASVISTVFDAKIYKLLSALKNAGKKVIIQQDVLKSTIDKALIQFIRIPGNHCAWTERVGFNALSVFDLKLKEFIVKHIDSVLSELGLSVSNIHAIVEEKILKLKEGEIFELPSGLTVSLFHPQMARTKTTSIRLQSVLQYTKTQIAIEGNFHTAEALEEWDSEYGQRMCEQIGTIKTTSGFERGKLKTVDFGVGYLAVKSYKKRIIKTQVAFYGQKRNEEIIQKNNIQILKTFEKVCYPKK